MTPGNYDPEATVWRAVAELERKRFTRAEIADALIQTGFDVDPDPARWQ